MWADAQRDDRFACDGAQMAIFLHTLQWAAPFPSKLWLITILAVERHLGIIPYEFLYNFL